MNRYRVIGILMVCLVGGWGRAAEIVVSDSPTAGSFPIVSGQPTAILVDPNDATAVGTASSLFADDVERVTGKRPTLLKQLPQQAEAVMVIGTLGESCFIRALTASGKLDPSPVQGRWEAFVIAVVMDPFPGISRALVIVGSDRRGAAYGVFSLSEAMGVSPWYDWADVRVQKKKRVYIADQTIIQGGPSVKYRGIFINDEDWGLQPWAAKHLDTDIQDIGPKTYARVFELLLRLKANYLWPAMHPCTKAFNLYTDNKVVADRYGIVMGSSHCEPMLCNNVTEWDKTAMGAWDYETNSKVIDDYWRDRIKQNGVYENVYTIGMRGIHDSGIPGGGSDRDKKERLERIIRGQRSILSEYVHPDPSSVPQIFCPYKEVLKIYQLGLDVPEDVTLVWPDDNFGYLRNLSTPAERRRKGGAGIYYHLSYWGRPQDFLWISSTSPAMIAYEMSKAYAYGADRLWVFNVGDIKPCEMEMTFALQLAYDIDRWPVQKAMEFLNSWNRQAFGDRYAGDIAEIQKEYYRLTQQAKPEHADQVSFSSEVQTQRLADYDAMAKRAEGIYAALEPVYKDAYYQLVLYPVKGAALMNRKQTSISRGDVKAAQQAYGEIQTMTRYYNQEMAGGKWDGIMDSAPRKRPVFRRPDQEISAAKQSAKSDESNLEAVFVFPAAHYTRIRNTSISRWETIEGLGIEASAMTVLPYETESIDASGFSEAPSICYSFDGSMDRCQVEVRFLPTHRVCPGKKLRYAVRVDDDPIQVQDINTAAGSGTWSRNVLRGYSAGKTEHRLKPGRGHQISIYLLDPGMVLSRVCVY